MRPSVGALETVTCCAELLGTSAALTLAIGQLPVGDPANPTRWIGLPGAPTGSHTSLAFVGGAPDTTATFSGLLIDEWVETIPSDQELGAVSFHYDAPTAQPPQAILLAVPPDPTGEAWLLDDLSGAVAELIDLAHARYAGPADLTGDGADLTQYLPAAYLPAKETDSVAGIEPSRLIGQALIDQLGDYGTEIDATSPVINNATGPQTDDQGHPGCARARRGQ